MKITQKIRAQIDSDIAACEKHTDIKGSERLYSELVARYKVLYPNFTDGLPTNGKAALVESEYDYRPELAAIASKLKMYLLIGEDTASPSSPLKDKVMEFILRGERIGREEYHPAERGFAISFVSGPKYDSWMSEINIFNERYLKEHPLFDSIHSAYFHRKTNPSAYGEMMGHLNALASDDVYWGQSIPEEDTMVIRSRKTIDQMLAEDIARCELYLKKPSDEAVGKQLYFDITGKYDSIINGLGNGLYMYIPETHFYIPEIDGESLQYNLNMLLNKMRTYLAVNYPPTEPIPIQEEKKMSNKVFVVHGHNIEAKLEMARALEKDGFEPIILHEQPDAGLTIIEKIERYADVCYAVVLYTECDKGRDKNSPVDQEQFRARQNVVFEHGYLIGKLGRERVSALVKGSVETPGDISGVVYINMDKEGAWKMQLAKNMQDVGLTVDMNRFCR